MSTFASVSNNIIMTKCDLLSNSVLIVIPLQFHYNYGALSKVIIMARCEPLYQIIIMAV